VIATGERETGRRVSRYLAVGVLALILALVVACGRAPEPPEARAPSIPRPEATASAPAEPDTLVPQVERRDRTARRPAPRGSPMRVTIPAIAVDAVLVGVGLQTDGAMEVPDFGVAGWYAHGPAPGHPGPALIAAHVDSRAGPDVFYRLGELEAGDDLEVHYDSGDRVTFVVESREQVPKEALPGDRIWPVTADPLLTLITCGGEFDPSVQRYRDNIIIYTIPSDQRS
jgi:sortase (surface protein transpeptidase)